MNDYIKIASECIITICGFIVIYKLARDLILANKKKNED